MIFRNAPTLVAALVAVFVVTGAVPLVASAQPGRAVKGMFGGPPDVPGPFVDAPPVEIPMPPLEIPMPPVEVPTPPTAPGPFNETPPVAAPPPPPDLGD